MNKFTDVRIALRNWLTQFNLVKQIMPYHLHILFGGVLAVFLPGFVLQVTNEYYQIFNILRSFGYWAFILGIFLTLASSSVKYLPYALWFYVFHLLFPFKNIAFTTLVSAVVYGYFGVLAFKYSAVEKNGFGANESSTMVNKEITK